MSVVSNNILAGASGQGGSYEIERSLRFNGADTPELTFTPTSSGNTRTFTISFWTKRSTVGDTAMLLQTGDTYGNLFRLYFSADKLRFHQYDAGVYRYELITTQVFRDLSAWYHIVIAIDTTNATTSERAKIYVNGVQVTTFDIATYPASNRECGWNANIIQRIGREYTTTYGSYYNYNGYLAEFHNIDGQALAPTDFGETDDNGVWQPKLFDGTYGTNGFHLDFADNSSNAALGTDTSPNGNTWTVNNLSVAAGAGNDSLVDSPTNGTQTDTGAGGEVVGNYATWNPLVQSTSTFSNGNLQVTTSGGSGYPLDMANFYTPAGTGKWYWEFELSALSGTNYTMVGMLPGDSDYVQGVSNIPTEKGGISVYVGYNGAVNAASGAATAGTATATFAVGDILGWAFDAENGTLQCYKNGVSQGTQFTNIRTDIGWVFCVTDYDNSATATYVVNFGQRAFAYTAPSGYKCLNTANLPDPTIADGSQYFDTKLYTGNGSTQTISGLGFSPDFVWIKSRTTTGLQNYLLDTVRGATKRLISNATFAESTVAQSLTSFSSDGFSVGSEQSVNQNNDAFVGWAWDAGSSTVSNTDGSITSQVRANPSAGFSIATFTGNGSNATIGHGLNDAPSFYIVKARTSSGYTDFWSVYHKSLGASAYIKLNETAASSTGSSIWNSTAPTSSVFSVDSASIANANGVDYVAYCFAPVAGYSSIGSYTGNGSTDGPFVYTGMRPSWILIRAINSTGDWIIWDTVRDTYNVATSLLYPNLNSEEQDGIANRTPSMIIDVLSNGFKCRGTNNDLNAIEDYIYIAFAEHPFKTARAR